MWRRTLTFSPGKKRGKWNTGELKRLIELKGCSRLLKAKSRYRCTFGARRRSVLPLLLQAYRLKRAAE